MEGLWEGDEGLEGDNGGVQVNSKGHCLLCLANLNLNPGLEFRAGGWEQMSSSSPLTSLQNLSRYLGIDPSSRLTLGNGQSSAQRVILARKVWRFGIRGEVCVECGALNDQFSELQGELERIQLEMADCLKLIRWKLTEGDQSGQAEFLGMEEGWPGELEFVEAIRGEAAERCSVKVLDLVPAPTPEPASDEEGAQGRPHKTPLKKLRKKGKKKPRRPETGTGHDQDQDDRDGDEHMAGVSDRTDRDPVHMEISDGEGHHNREAETTTPSTSTRVTSTPGRKQNKMVNTAREQYKCPECLKDFNSLINLRFHRRLHFDFGRTFTCYECSAEFPSMTDLEGHWKSCREPLSQLENPIMEHIKCHLCSEQFGSLRALREHAHKAHLRGEPAFPCETCGKTFRLLKGLQAHQRDVHWGAIKGDSNAGRMSASAPRHLPAPEADMVMEEPGAATDVHAFDKEWTCGECGNHFPSRLSFLDHHKNTHMGRKIYYCHRCHQVFPKRPLLRKHKLESCRRPHVDTPCSCLQCRKEFTSAGACRNHIKTVHERRKKKLEGTEDEEGTGGPEKKKTRRGRGIGQEGNGHDEGEGPMPIRVKEETNPE